MSDVEKAIIKLASDGVVRRPQDLEGGESLLTGMVRGALMRSVAELQDTIAIREAQSVMIGSDYSTSIRVTMKSGDYLVTVQKILP